MADVPRLIHDLVLLRQGGRVDGQGPRHPYCTGLVEDLMPQRNVACIRNLAIEERRMVSTDEHRIFQPVH